MVKGGFRSPLKLQKEEGMEKKSERGQWIYEGADGKMPREKLSKNVNIPSCKDGPYDILKTIPEKGIPWRSSG